MKKSALLNPVGTPETYGDGIGVTQEGPTRMDQDTQEPHDGLMAEKSVLESMDSEEELMETPVEYSEGRLSPVDGDGYDYNWVDDSPHPKKAQVTIYRGADAPLASFHCGIAENVQQQVIGLQSYKSLDETAGLLFEYDQPKDLLYHMGTVSFPIDIIFVDENQAIKRIYPNIRPGTMATFGCADVQYVLEVYGGLSDRLGIDFGDTVDIEKSSPLLRTASEEASMLGFRKSAILTHSDVYGMRSMSWYDFPIVNVPRKLRKQAEKGAELDMISDLLNFMPRMVKSVTAFYLDGLVDEAPLIRTYRSCQEVDDQWRGRTDADILGRTVSVSQPKKRDVRLEKFSNEVLVGRSFSNFMYLSDNEEYNKEVDKFLWRLRQAKKSGHPIIICTSNRDPINLVKLLDRKIFYHYAEDLNLESADILQISDSMGAFNIIECIADRYPSADIEVVADDSLLKKAGIPVPDNIKENGRKIIKLLEAANDLVEKSMEKIGNNKTQYEKYQDDQEAIAKTKGQLHQAVNRHTRIVKGYLIKIRDAIRLLNEIKDITTTMEIIDGLVSASKSASDAAEKVFDMKEKVAAPDFFIEFSAKVDGYEKATDDLISSVDRAKDYINASVLGMVILSE